MVQRPLAEELRPKKLSQYIGQKEIVGRNGILTKLISGAKETNFFPSLIFWGPPGSGKTTLARIISNELDREYYEFSAVNTSTKDIEEIVKRTDSKPHVHKHQQKLIKDSQIKSTSISPIIFIDEIHRFNKAQQDKLLPYIEKGTIIFIGATTENPSFEVIGPLLSRSRVIVLERLSETSLQKIVERALKKIKAKIDADGLNFLIESANGDARVVLNVLEIADSLTQKTGSKRKSKITLTEIEQALQRRQFTFDKKGEEYYNVISAFIKSMRANNANAALYYLARMVEAGQDPLYIARRMVVFASEDIGMAQPTALVVANEVFRACETIGYPECQENLAHGVVYLATAKKDRSAYNAYMAALEDVKRYGNLKVPLKIRNPVTKLMKDLKYGENYIDEKYELENEDLLPEKIKDRKYYKKN